MSLRFIDSFDHYTNMAHKYDTVSVSTGGVSAGNGRNTTDSFVVSSNVSGGCSVSRIIGGTATTIIVGIALKLRLTPLGTRIILRLQEGSTVHVDLRVNTSRQLFVTRNGTQIGSTGATVLAVGAYYFVEFKAFIHDTTGTIDVRINGVSEISGTSLDTRNAGTPLIDTILLGDNTQNTGSNQYDIDDVYVCDIAGSVNNNFLGDSRVAALLPSGAGTTTQWTPSAGSNFQNVDDAAPDDDTTYNSETTASDKDTFAMGNLPSTAATVHGIQEGTRHRKDDAGARTLRQVVRSGGVDYEGGDITVLDTYSSTYSIRETNPNTAAAWTSSGIDAMEAGYKLQA